MSEISIKLIMGISSQFHLPLELYSLYKKQTVEPLNLSTLNTCSFIDDVLLFIASTITIR